MVVVGSADVVADGASGSGAAVALALGISSGLVVVAAVGSPSTNAVDVELLMTTPGNIVDVLLVLIP